MKSTVLTSLKSPVQDSLTGIPVMEHFYTIQGEGFYQGRPAYFIRIGGCDVGCAWCDVKESWDAATHPVADVKHLADETMKYQSPICVVTGGEPTMYNLTELTAALHQAKKKTHLETAAAYPITGEWDWICISPKKFKAPLSENLGQADELKVIVYNKSDFEWAEEYALLVSPQCKLFLQPEWSKSERMMPMIVDYVKQHPKWEISLQIHKYLGIP